LNNNITHVREISNKTANSFQEKIAGRAFAEKTDMPTLRQGHLPGRRDACAKSAKCDRPKDGVRPRNQQQFPGPTRYTGPNIYFQHENGFLDFISKRLSKNRGKNMPFGLKNRAGKLILYCSNSAQFIANRRKKQMLRKKNRTIAVNAPRSGCGSDIQSPAVGNTARANLPAAVENHTCRFDQTYPIPVEMRSTR
jgi:hypothetical protein